MEAINFIKEHHKPFIGKIDKTVVDEEGHNYDYYVCKFIDSIDDICELNRCTTEFVKTIGSLYINNTIKCVKDSINRNAFLTFNGCDIFNDTYICMPFMSSATFTKCKFADWPKTIYVDMLSFQRCKTIPSYFKCNNLSVEHYDSFVVPDIGQKYLHLNYCKNIVVPNKLNVLTITRCKNVDIINKDTIDVLCIEGEYDISNFHNLKELILIDTSTSELPKLPLLKKLQIRESTVSISDDLINLEELLFYNCKVPFIPMLPKLKKIILINCDTEQTFDNIEVNRISI